MVAAHRGRRTGRSPWGLVGMLVLVVVAESFIARHDPDYADLGDYDWGQAAHAARREGPRHDILCFGDSQVKTGVVPQLLAARSGRSAYSLAVFGGQAPLSFFLLRQALAAGARPEAVIVDFKSYLLSLSPQTNDAHWAEVLTMRDAFDLIWATRDARFAARLFLTRFLPSVDNRNVIRVAVTRALANQPHPQRFELLAHLRNQRLNRGASLCKFSASPLPPNNYGDRGLFPANWRCDPVNALYLERFLALAERHHLRVYWLLPPQRPGVQQGRERVGADAAYLRVVRSAQARHGNLFVLDGRHSLYDDSVFSDHLHFDPRGATTMSSDIADLLRQSSRPDALRWVRLPDYRPLKFEITIEDLDQSRLALERGSDLRMIR